MRPNLNKPPSELDPRRVTPEEAPTFSLPSGETKEALLLSYCYECSILLLHLLWRLLLVNQRYDSRTRCAHLRQSTHSAARLAEDGERLESSMPFSISRRLLGRVDLPLSKYMSDILYCTVPGSNMKSPAQIPNLRKGVRDDFPFSCPSASSYARTAVVVLSSLYWAVNMIGKPLLATALDRAYSVCTMIQCWTCAPTGTSSSTLLHVGERT